MIGDDTDDKIRRNLVAFSSVVILGAWLGLPLSAVADRVLAAGTVDKLEPWRVWSAVVAELVYLVLRFRFSKETRSDAFAAREEWRKVVRRQVERLLRRDFHRFVQTGRDSPHFKDLVSRVTSEQQTIEAGLQSIGQSKPGIGGVHFQTKAPSEPDPISIEVGTADFHFHWPQRPGSAAGSFSIDFRVKGWTLRYLKAKALVIIAGYSVACVRFVVPIALALAALLISLIKLCFALWVLLSP